MFSLIIVLICSIFGAFFINKILELITARSSSSRKTIEEVEATTNEMEQSNDGVVGIPNNKDSNSPEKMHLD